MISRERPQSFGGGVLGITLESIERYLTIWPQHDVELFVEVMLQIDDGFRHPINVKAERDRRK